MTCIYANVCINCKLQCQLSFLDMLLCYVSFFFCSDKYKNIKLVLPAWPFQLRLRSSSEGHVIYQLVGAPLRHGWSLEDGVPAVWEGVGPLSPWLAVYLLLWLPLLASESIDFWCDDVIISSAVVCYCLFEHFLFWFFLLCLCVSPCCLAFLIASFSCVECFVAWFAWHLIYAVVICGPALFPLGCTSSCWILCVVLLLWNVMFLHDSL